jgi:hypothetical protein
MGKIIELIIVGIAILVVYFLIVNIGLNNGTVVPGDTTSQIIDQTIANTEPISQGFLGINFIGVMIIAGMCCCVAFVYGINLAIRRAVAKQ